MNSLEVKVKLVKNAPITVIDKHQLCLMLIEQIMLYKLDAPQQILEIK